MNKRKKIYRGFNKRRKHNIPKVISVVCILAVSSYGFYKIKDYMSLNYIKNMFVSFEMPDLLGFMTKEEEEEKEEKEEYTYNDIEESLNEIENEEESTQEIKSVTINGWEFYSIQIASIEDSKEYEDLEEELRVSKIPYSIMEVDSISKVQIYGSLNKDSLQPKLEEVRENYPDAFLSEIQIPVLALQYTDKYSYTEEISNQLNILIETFKEESEFWELDNMDMAKYNEILTKRKNSTSIIKEECEKIDYDEAKAFKDNLISYIEKLELNIDESSKYANQEIYNTSQSLFLSSMQDYFMFIESIQ